MTVGSMLLDLTDCAFNIISFHATHRMESVHCYLLLKVVMMM